MSWRLPAALAAAVAPAMIAQAQTTAFTYQGYLTESGAPAEGAYDMSFSLWEDESSGSMLAGPISFSGLTVEAGRFQASLDFGTELYSTQSVWVQVEVGGVALAPRQEITGAPLSLQTRGMFVNDADTFAGIGRQTQVTTRERFGIGTGAGVGEYGGMYVDTASEGWPFYGYSTGGTAGAWHYLDGQTGIWHLYNGGARLSVTSDGYVGIGEIAPSEPLEVVTTTENNAIIARNTRTGSNTAIAGSQTDGTDSTGVLGFIQQGTRGQGVFGVSYNSEGIGVRGAALGSPSLIVGVQGEAASSAGYDFLAAGSGVNYGSTSSRRWKHNIEQIERPLTLLGRLRGVTFDWDAEHGGHHDVGMIAEEVGEVVPEIVVYEENGVDANGMDYAKLTPLLVEAVKELRAEKDREIGSLRAENEELRARVASLEVLIGQMLSNGDRE